MKEKEDKNTALYPMPDQVKNIINAPKKKCVYGFDLVYLLDQENKYAFVFGDNAGVQTDLKEDGFSLHKKYHEQVLNGQGVVYNWTIKNDPGKRVYQSVLLPLKFNDSTKPNVLGVVSSEGSPLCMFPRNTIMETSKKTLTSMLIQAKEKEKKKITSALHDELGSSAVILTSILSILKEDIIEDKKDSALKRADELNEKLKECIEKLKNIIVNLRPPSLDAVGLDGAVKELVESFNKFGKVNITYTYTEEDAGHTDDEITILLYRTVQESLNNVMKHANATQAAVKLESLYNLIKIEVSDNGTGFTKDKKKNNGKIGLRSMEESIKYLGGKFEVKSVLGKGTTVKVSCPKIAYEVAL